MAAPEIITPYADLDELLAELLGHWQRILGENLVGAYVQGSFALGSGDQQSDCDWLVATRGSLTDLQIAQLRKLHDDIPTREGHWCHDLEGSYAPGLFMPVVPADLLRREAAASLPTLLDDLASWIDIDTLAWGQRYAVVTACRILYTLETAEVASKQGALEWALRTLARRWQPLLAQVRDERSLGWEPDRLPRVGEADTARMFIGYVLARAGRADALEQSG